MEFSMIWRVIHWALLHVSWPLTYPSSVSCKVFYCMICTVGLHLVLFIIIVTVETCILPTSYKKNVTFLQKFCTCTCIYALKWSLLFHNFRPFQLLSQMQYAASSVHTNYSKYGGDSVFLTSCITCLFIRSIMQNLHRSVKQNVYNYMQVYMVVCSYFAYICIKMTRM